MIVLIILAVLFGTLFVLVPMLERSKFRISAKQTAKLSRWILPLVGLLIVLRIFEHI
jgi:hypothetical protein